MPKLPPLNSLRAFEAAGRHLNFRVAAEELGVTQGAVAQQVRALELRLGRKLFVRKPRGLLLTDDGRRYLAPVRQAFALLATATDDLAGRPRRLRISVTPSFASKWLVPRLSGFAEEHPGVDVEVEASTEIANFQSDGIDVAVRQGQPPFAAGLVAEPLFAADYVAVCAPALRDGNPPLRQVSDLANHTLLHDGHGLWPLFLDRIGAVAGDRSMNFNQTALAIDAAISGQGIALASAPLVADALATGALCQPLREQLTSGPAFYVVAARQSRNPDLVNIMRDWLSTQVSGGR